MTLAKRQDFDERRTALRMAVAMRIRIETYDGPIEATTCDLSDTGMFLEVDREFADRVSLGDVYYLQVVGTPMPMPVVRGRVRRITPEGVAIEVCGQGNSE